MHARLVILSLQQHSPCSAAEDVAGAARRVAASGVAAEVAVVSMAAAGGAAEEAGTGAEADFAAVAVAPPGEADAAAGACKSGVE